AQAMPSKKSLRIFVELMVAAVCVTATAQGKHPAVIEKISVIGENPFRLQIHTSAALTPEVQLVSSPERLVIDLRNSLPAAALRKITINRGEVISVRASLYSQKPPVTRAVVHLNAPQRSRAVRDGSACPVARRGRPQGTEAPPA